MFCQKSEYKSFLNPLNSYTTNIAKDIFIIHDFNQELRGRWSTELVDNYSSFENVFIDVLNRHALIKKKVIRANHAPYVTKALRKAIMKRSQLEKIYFKKRTQESFKKYKKQKNYCSRLYKREIKSFFESVNSNKITDNKTF